MAKKWYVLHTYSGYENKVKKNLETRIETMGLENNVFAIEIPTEMVTEIKEGGRSVESEKKVFPGYVLVRMELDDRSWAAVRNTPGVTGFVGADGNPAPLTRDEYNKIMKRTSREAPKKTSSSLEVGQSVKVVSGPLAEFDGVVSEVSPMRARFRSWCPSSGARPRSSSRSTRWRRSDLKSRDRLRARVDRGFSRNQVALWIGTRSTLS